MHHNFGLTPFPLTSTRTTKPSTRVAAHASPVDGSRDRLADVTREEAPATDPAASTTPDVAAEEGTE